MCGSCTQESVSYMKVQCSSRHYIIFNQWMSDSCVGCTAAATGVCADWTRHVIDRTGAPRLPQRMHPPYSSTGSHPIPKQQ